MFQGILPAVRAGRCDVPLTIQIEHAETAEGVSMRMTWPGKSFNPLTQGDEFSMMLITNVTRSASYSYEDKNELVIRV